MENKFTKIVIAARTGDYANAARLLNKALIEVQSELSKGKTPVSQLSKIKVSIKTMTLMQKQSDWVGFADVIEYEFIPLWRTLTQSQK